MSHQALGLVRDSARDLDDGRTRHLARHGAPPDCTAKAPVGQSLAIVSGKGGVGKSTLALNLALAAAGEGASALLVDGDAGLANLDLLMGVVPHHDLSDWRAGRVELERTLCRGPNGLNLLVVGADGHCTDSLAGALTRNGDRELEALLHRHALTVFDLGAGIGNGVLDVAERCQRVWLVVTSEPTSLADAYATAKRLWERSPELEIELIVNRASDRATARRTHQALDRLAQRFLGRGLPLRGVLPDDTAMPFAVARQTPVLLDAPDSAVSARIRSLTESLLEEMRVEVACG